MTARDILEIENLQGRYMHLLISGNFEDVRPLFADNPETSFSFVNKKRPPFIGAKEIYEKMFLERMVSSFPEYDRFHAGGQITVPFVDVDADGMRGVGMFPSFGFFVQGKIFGYDGPPYPAIAGYGMWFHEFIKEDGQWKFLHFHIGNVGEARAWEWNPEENTGYAELGIARQMPEPPKPYEI